MTRLLRAVLCVAGLVSAAFAFFVDVDPVGGGGTTLEAFAAYAAASALMFVAAAAGRLGPRAAILGGALLLGGAGQLGLTQPLWLSYLRIRSHEIGAGLNPLFAGFVAIEAAVLGMLFLRSSAESRCAVFACLRRLPRAAIPLLILAAGSAQAMEFLPRGRLRSFAVQSGAVFALTVLHLSVLAAVGKAVAASFRRTVGPDGPAADSLDSRSAPSIHAVTEAFEHSRNESGSRRAAILAAVFATCLSGVLAHAALDAVPHIPDEVAYIFQAETFAGGALDGTPLPDAEAMKAYCVEAKADRTFAVTPPGWPAVLALGVQAGLPWFVNPLLAGIAVLLAHALLRRLAGGAAADLAAILLATSPWLLFVSATYMTHAVSLALFAAGWLGVEHAARRRSFVAAFFGGAAVGYLFLVRPLDGLLVGAMLGLRALGVAGDRLRWIDVVALGVGFFAVAVWIFPYNAHYTGGLLSTPINEYIDRLWYPGANRLGFGPDVGNPPKSWLALDPTPGHGPIDVLYNTNHNLYCLNTELFGWPGGGLALFGLGAAFRKRRRTDGERLALWMLSVLGVGYSLYWFSGGPDFGPRYWYLMILPLVLLASAAIRDVVSGLESLGASPLAARKGVRAAAFLAIGFGVMVFVPWRVVAKYREYRGWHADYAQIAAEPASAGKLFVVKTAGDGDDADWLSARFLNSPFCGRSDSPRERARPVFVRDLGEDSLAVLRRAFPDRPVERLQGRSMVDGPVRRNPTDGR